MLYIKYGSIFDEKCDLLVLPCDSKGYMTSWVRNEITNNELPIIGSKIPYGKVGFIETNNNYRNAYYIGYAASVENVTQKSSIKVIENIIFEILVFAAKNEMYMVNMPVFGTGAGGLDYEDVISLYNKHLVDSKITFNVYIPDKNIANIYVTDSQQFDSSITRKFENPRVFISYSWGDIVIQNWALDLVRKLRENGVNAIIDKYHLKPGYDMPQWMTDELIKADKVLLICDKFYSEKANIRKGGAGWETMIIQGDMLSQGSSNKYIAIACGEFDKSIPIYMKSKLAMSKEDIDEDFNQLLTHIFEVDIAPEIGEIPEWLKSKMINKAL